RAAAQHRAEGIAHEKKRAGQSPADGFFLMFSFRTLARETVEQGRKGRRRNLGAKDGPKEPPRNGLTRVQRP
ncbi:hypothetical protein AAGG49_22945, partial [Stenotrophomonas maltophilia]|uniref:hypothetical protein n=1 Tax=Stenotrophomonas maltophilia TaxID=40324 RepID=UPI00313B5F2D